MHGVGQVNPSPGDSRKELGGWELLIGRLLQTSSVEVRSKCSYVETLLSMAKFDVAGSLGASETTADQRSYVEQVLDRHGTCECCQANPVLPHRAINNPVFSRSAISEDAEPRCAIGDILAYRYVEPSSKAFPELSSPQVGKVSAFDHVSSVIVLVKASEFEVFSEYDPLTNVSLEKTSYPYKEDGLLEIKVSALIDIRLLKAHDSTELACLPEGALNRFKNNWEVASERSNWNQSESQYTANKENGWNPTDSTNTRSWSCKEPSFLFPRGNASDRTQRGVQPGGCRYAPSSRPESVADPGGRASGHPCRDPTRAW
ncbi:hypothetical protein KSP40_PGU000258 [Platanthera guangdongensis]|uniref:Coilin tudor domain-containing protein n=1 Tax=Platanthera guangdongensis TaxID=2320717 RepID=A0ABR2MTS4_9ASPA